jgi:hypothetical protein
MAFRTGTMLYMGPVAAVCRMYREVSVQEGLKGAKLLYLMSHCNFRWLKVLHNMPLKALLYCTYENWCNEVFLLGFSPQVFTYQMLLDEQNKCFAHPATS